MRRWQMPREMRIHLLEIRLRDARANQAMIEAELVRKEAELAALARQTREKGRALCEADDALGVVLWMLRELFALNGRAFGDDAWFLLWGEAVQRIEREETTT